MIHVLVASELPDPLRQKEAVEALLRASFADFPGSWLVQVRCARIPTWWTIVIRRAEDDFKRTLVLDPSKQTPQYVAAALATLLLEIT